MAQIADGVGGTNLAGVHSNHGLYATLIDSAGNEPGKIPTGSYCIAISPGRITGTTAAAKAIWSMVNGTSATVSMYLRRLHLVGSFDGTAVANTQFFQVQRTSAIYLTAGTQITLPGGAVPKNTSNPNSQLGDARFAVAGLTDTSVVYSTALAVLPVPRAATAAVVPFVLDWHVPNEYASDFVLKPGEGIAITLGVIAVVGDCITGFAEWDER